MGIEICVIGGAGYMGWSGLQALLALKDEFKDFSIKYFVIDIKPLDAVQVKKCEKQNWPVPDSSYKDLLTYLGKRYTKKDKIFLIYDATSPDIRAENLDIITSKKQYSEAGNIYYIGEKPMVEYQNDLRHVLLMPHCYCEFIETENPVTKELKNWIEKENLTIKEMFFWRAGGIAIRKAALASRLGVVGGALLDKAPHDLSISTTLLDPDKIHTFNVTHAETEKLCVGAKHYYLQKNTLLKKDNDEYELGESDFGAGLADGLFNLQVEWVVKNDDGTQSVIPATYLSSWIGYAGGKAKKNQTPSERRFVKALKKLGLEKDDWYMAHEHEGPSDEERKRVDWSTYIPSNQKVKFVEEHIRVALIDCGDRQLFCSYLSDATSGKNRICRQVIEFKVDGSKVEVFNEPAKYYAEYKEEDLKNIFRSVLYQALNMSGRESKYIGTRAIELVHDVIFTAQQQEKVSSFATCKPIFDLLIK